MKKNNLFILRELVNNTYRISADECLFSDSFNNLIYVNCETGDVSGVSCVVCVDGKKRYTLNKHKEGNKLTKNNGYMYIRLDIKNDNFNGVITASKHDIVAMIKNKEEFDKLAVGEYTPICNHKNNKSWDNRSCNLEWVKHGDNIKHGFIVKKIYEMFDNNKYAHIESNNGFGKFTILNKGISCKDINKFIEIKNSEKENSAVKKDKKFITEFIDWLIEEKIW